MRRQTPRPGIYLLKKKKEIIKIIIEEICSLCRSEERKIRRVLPRSTFIFCVDVSLILLVEKGKRIRRNRALWSQVTKKQRAYVLFHEVIASHAYPVLRVLLWFAFAKRERRSGDKGWTIKKGKGSRT